MHLHLRLPLGMRGQHNPSMLCQERISAWVPVEQRGLGLLVLVDPTVQAVCCEISRVARRKKYASSQLLAS